MVKLMVGEREVGKEREVHQFPQDNSGSRAGLREPKNMQICGGEAERRKEMRQEVKYEILMEKIGRRRRRGEAPKHVRQWSITPSWRFISSSPRLNHHRIDHHHWCHWCLILSLNPGSMTLHNAMYENWGTTYTSEYSINIKVFTINSFIWVLN